MAKPALPVENGYSKVYSGLMATRQGSTDWLHSTLHRILACFSLNWVSVLVDLVGGLGRWALPQSNLGIYEILEYDASLDLVDPKGLTAIFKKRQRVRFLQDNIIGFEDYAWGDGQIFADYKVSPGIEADRYQEGDRWNVLISLRGSKQRGDVEEFYMERTVKNGFMASEEWQQVELRHPTAHLRLSIVFPKQRPCQRATLRMRRRDKVIELGTGHFQALPDGRQKVRWETRNVTPLEVFTLRWWW